MKTVSMTVDLSTGHHAEPSARNWVGSTHNQAITLRSYISSAASPHVHNGIEGEGGVVKCNTWPLLHDSSLYPEESWQDHDYTFSSKQIKTTLKQS